VNDFKRSAIQTLLIKKIKMLNEKKRTTYKSQKKDIQAGEYHHTKIQFWKEEVSDQLIFERKK